MDPDHVLPGQRQQSIGGMVPQILFFSERQMPDVGQRSQVFGSEVQFLEFVPVEGNIVVSTQNEILQS